MSETGMSETGILGFGAYVPITRLQRSAIHAANGWFAGGLRGLAKGEKAVANWAGKRILKLRAALSI